MKTIFEKALSQDWCPVLSHGPAHLNLSEGFTSAFLPFVSGGQCVDILLLLATRSTLGLGSDLKMDSSFEQKLRCYYISYKNDAMVCLCPKHSSWSFIV